MNKQRTKILVVVLVAVALVVTAISFVVWRQGAGAGKGEESPAAAGGAPTKVEVTLHYQRWDNKYDGWNVWGWVEGKDGAEYPFTDKQTATFTLKNKAGIKGLGLIVKRVEGDNIWAEKDPDSDLMVPADKIKNAKVEVWVVSGYKKLYYSAAETPKEAPKPGECGKLHTQEFNDKYYYDGELGAIYTPAATTFRVWAPTAQKVEFVNDSKSGDTQLMKPGEKGTWEITLDGDQKGTKYRYRLTFKDGDKEKVNETVDPYARAVTANAASTVVVDAPNVAPEGWDANQRMGKFAAMRDAIIYEAHVRDLTIAPDNGIKHKGKFLGLTEAGTKTKNGNPSGLDYLKSLGVTHVQFLPIYDFGSIDEKGDLGFNKQYNWGYDPQNYNVPEGSYSSDPANPEARIRELKQMIAAMHENGLRVIMDVVYNHVHKPEVSPLQLTVPDYYFRMNEFCELNGDTGVGNATASEQPMMRKYIVDSITYWAKYYNLDGFRFDLMGIHDVDTMKAVRAALDQIDPSIVVLGEGWDMWKNQKDKDMLAADQDNAKKMPGIAFFNDSYRDSVKGSVFDEKVPGFINGSNKAIDALNLYNNIKGAQTVRWYLGPDQSVLYNEAHDNLTMFDKLKASMPGTADAELAQRAALGTATQYLSNGAVFIHAGQEFMRTKGGDHNSYKSPDSVNRFDYDRAAKYAPYVKFFRQLNKFRHDYDFMRLGTYDEINQRYSDEFAEGTKLVDSNHVGYRVKDAFGAGKDGYVYINADKKAWQTVLPAGQYGIMIEGTEVFDSPKALTSDGKVEVPALSTLVVRVS